MPTIPPDIYGPAGLLVFLVAVVWRLWKLHEAEDQRRDNALDLLVKQLPELISSNKSLADTIEERLSDSQEPNPGSRMAPGRRPVSSKERKDGA